MIEKGPRVIDPAPFCARSFAFQELAEQLGHLAFVIFAAGSSGLRFGAGATSWRRRIDYR